MPVRPEGEADELGLEDGFEVKEEAVEANEEVEDAAEVAPLLPPPLPRSLER